MPQAETTRLDTLRDFLDDKIEEALTELQAMVPDDAKGMGAFLQTVMEVLSFHVGYADAFACLGNISREARDEMRKQAFRNGQKNKLEEHNSSCEDGARCEEAQRLTAEVYPN